jgi:Family of unknown function (DUF6283)
MKKPCDNCPWRRDALPGYWDPQHFRDIWQSCQDDGQALMLCHKSKPGEKVNIPCAGYVIVVGYESIGVRIATTLGRLNPEEYKTDEPLYETFEEMMDANEVELPQRNRFTRRS